MRVLSLLLGLILLMQNLEAGYRSIDEKRNFLERLLNNAEQGGYSDFAVGEDEHVIIYEGSDLDSSWQGNIGFLQEKQAGKKRIYSYALKRAGEVACQRGYPYFVVLDEQAGNHIGRTDAVSGFSVNTYTVALRIKLLGEVGQEETYDSWVIANWNPN